MLAIPPYCVVFCVTVRCIPVDLYVFVAKVLFQALSQDTINDCGLDSMAAQLGTGADDTSNIISFSIASVLGTIGHLYARANAQLKNLLLSGMVGNE